MFMSKIIFCTILSICLGVYLSEQGLVNNWKKKEKAFKECISELSNKCSRTIEYAILLENENARLNKIKNSCKK